MKRIWKCFILAVMIIGINAGVCTLTANAAGAKLTAPVVTLSNVASSGKIKIKWETVDNAVSYKVYRSLDGEKWTRLITTKGTSITNTSAVAGKKYYYKVKAIASKSAANSSFSKIKYRTCKAPYEMTEYQKKVVSLANEIATEWKTKYVQGKNGQKNSEGVYQFDCSGFSTYVLNTVMVKKIPVFRLTSSISKLYQMETVYNEGYPGEFVAKTVPFNDIQPGDVIFFSHYSANDHCGIYIGNNKFIHSTKSNGCVAVNSISGFYKEDLSEIRRYLPTKVAAANTKKTIGKGCSLYSKRGNDNSKVKYLNVGEKVTVLYTGNNPESYNQAYVKTADGTKGFLYAKNLK